MFGGMKSQSQFLRIFLPVATAALLGAALPSLAQPGRGPMGAGPSGPNFDAAMTKLFGEHQSFSATLQLQTDGGQGRQVTMTGKFACLEGKTRFEMDMASMQGANMQPQALARMKQMGLDKIVAVAWPEKKVNYMLYPGMSAYVEMPLQNAGATPKASDYKVDVTEQGSDTVDGHPCTKNKVVVTGPDGATHESTVWNATDLDKFPVKIETGEGGQKMTMLFKDVKLDKPDASLFEPPTDYKKYDNMMQLMMSRAGAMQH